MLYSNLEAVKFHTHDGFYKLRTNKKINQIVINVDVHSIFRFGTGI